MFRTDAPLSSCECPVRWTADSSGPKAAGCTCPSTSPRGDESRSRLDLAEERALERAGVDATAGAPRCPGTLTRTSFGAAPVAAARDDDAGEDMSALDRAQRTAERRAAEDARAGAPRCAATFTR